MGQTIEEFADCWARKNSQLSAVLRSFVRNILAFIVRMNEYLRSNFYTGLRLNANDVAQLLHEARENDCLLRTINSKGVLAFAKCVGHDTKYVR